METQEKQFPAKVSKLPLWIIEYIWAHKMADVLEDVDPSSWPEMDSQPLSLEDSGRLRVVSAKVYSIVRNRDIEHFEKVLNFLEETYRLLPRLVAPIKHMKIVFGLKTMLIMWMLKQERGMIDTMFKINQFFPNRLPQYQNQCNQREIFLMKKNHLDFKDLAQSLAMDKVKLQRYVTNQMQQQYGENYAQKVEDRLLQYLQKLETVLPGDAYIDKLLKKESPTSEEEKLLLEVISSDSATIATTLKKLLHCEVTVLDFGRALPEYRTRGPQLSKSPHCSTSFESNLKAVNFKTDLQFQGREEPADSDIPVNSPLLFENEKDLEFRPFQQTPRDDQMTKSVEKESCDGTNEELNQGNSEKLHEANSSPQFCSKHQRWVKSILQECPVECSDDLLRRANASVSPLLFQSSSSCTSTQDLTPSDLISCPADQQHPASDTSDHLQTPEKTCEKANCMEQMTSGSSSSSGSTSKNQPSPQPASFRASQIPLLSPKVQMVDVVSVGGPEISFNLHQAFPNRSSAAPRNHNSFSGNGAPSSPNPLENMQKAETDPGSRSASTSTVKERPAANPYRPSLSDGHSVSVHLSRDASTSPSASAFTKITPPTSSCQQNVPMSSIQHTHVSDALRQTASPPADVAAGSDTDGLQRAPLRLSLASQAVLLQSKLLQPCVTLTRLSAQLCHRASDGRSSAGHAERVARSGGGGGDDEGTRTEEEEDGDSSFDLNRLYSSHSSSSGGKNSTLWDPDYEPCIKKKRLLFEYEGSSFSYI